MLCTVLRSIESCDKRCIHATKNIEACIFYTATPPSTQPHPSPPSDRRCEGVPSRRTAGASRFFVCFVFLSFSPPCEKRLRGECCCALRSLALVPGLFLPAHCSARSRVEVKTEAADKTEGEWKEGEERRVPDRRAQLLILSRVLRPLSPPHGCGALRCCCRRPAAQRW